MNNSHLPSSLLPGQNRYPLRQARGCRPSDEQQQTRLRPLALMLAALGLLSLPVFAQLSPTALPSGGVVAAGGAFINPPGPGATLRVDQSSNKAVIDWGSFNIGSQAKVHFQQPSAASIVLNRVGAEGGKSIIHGALSATGQVWLLNPGGVLFGTTAQVNAAGLLASSLKLGNDDFLGGNYRFSRDGASGIVNQGTLSASDGGYIALLAPEVRNEGIIKARLGTVALASGDEMRLDFTGDRLIEIKVDQGAVNGLIDNKNLVQADGGWVLMSAGAASSLGSGGINSTGIVRANSLTEHGGVIRLEGGFVALGGTLSADGASGGRITVTSRGDLSLADRVSAKGSTGHGGQIDLSGDSVRLLSATLDASGATHGGLVRVGGAFQGGKPQNTASDAYQRYIARNVAQFGQLGALRNAQRTFVNDASRIDVSATTGSGGTVVVWSDLQTTFLGKLAGNGAAGGGAAEISSAGDLRYVNLSGLDLGNGQLLLDPKDIFIGDTTPSAVPPSVPFASNPTGTETIDRTSLQTLLSTGTSVTLQASNDIIFSSSSALVVDNSTGNGGNLTLQAGRSVQIFSGISTDNGNLSITANSSLADGVVNAQRDVGAASIMIGSTATINAGSASVSFQIKDGAGLTNNTAGTLILDGSVSAGQVSYSADKMTLLGSTTSSGRVVLTPFTTGREIWLGTTDSSSNLVLSDAELNTILSASVLQVGNASSGDILLKGSIAPSIGTLSLQTGGGISVVNASGFQIVVNNLAMRSVGDIALMGVFQPVNTLAASVTGAGKSIGFHSANTLTVGTVDGVAGISTTNGLVDLNIETGDLTVANSINVGSGLININSNAENKLFTLSSGASLNSAFAGTPTFVNTSCGSTLAVCVRFDRMTIDGSISASAANQVVELSTSGSGSSGAIDISRAVVLGADDTNDLTTGTGTLGLTNAELNRVSANTLVVGNNWGVTPGSNVVVAGAVNLTSAPNLILASDGSVVLNAPLTVANNLSVFMGAIGSLTQTSTAPLSASGLAVQEGASVLLDTASGGNSIGAVAGNVTGAFHVTNGATALSVANLSGLNGVVAAAGGIILNGAGAVNVNAPLIATSGTIDITAGGNLFFNANVSTGNSALTAVAGQTMTIANGVTLTVGTGVATLVTSNGPFVNNNGDSAIDTSGVTGSGRWLIYAADPATSSEGFSSYNKHYNQVYVPGARPAYASSGNWFLYSLAPVLNVSANTQTMTYGDARPSFTPVYSGLIDGDTALTAVSGTAVFSVTGTVSTSGNSTAGIHDIVYTGGLTNSLGYSVQNDSAINNELTVGQRNLAMTGLTVGNKVYNADRLAPLSGTPSVAPLSGALGLDIVTLGGTVSASFADKNVGSGKVVTVSGNTLEGADAGNYTLVAQTGLQADITPLAIVGDITAADKVYDTTTLATILTRTLTGVMAGDDVSYSGGTARFADKNAAIGKIVTGSGFSLSGADASNYTVNSTDTTTASISRANLHVTGLSALDKPYDATASATLSGQPTVTPLGGSTGSDDVTVGGVASGTFADSSVGNAKPVTVSGNLITGGADRDNYLLVQASGLTANITGTSSTAASATVQTTVSQESTSSTATSTNTTAATAIVTSGTGSSGASMSNFPLSVSVQASSAAADLPPPLPKLVLDARQSMPSLAGVLNRADLQAMNQQVQAARTQLFGDALALLGKNAKAADISDCAADGGELCIATSLVKAAPNGYLPVVKRKIALLIGNNHYTSPIPDLETAVNDVTAIAAQLRDKLGYEVKVVENATRKETIDSLNDLIQNTDHDDSVVVMYAGHGYLQESSKTGYWIPTDASSASPDKWISNESIARALRNIPAKQVMLISDSCYSGSLTKEGKVTETVGIQRAQMLTRRSVVAFSSGGDEPVTDEGHDNHSIFAWNMIQALGQMKDETSGQQLHAAIKAAVTKEYPQVPQYGTMLSAGHAPGGEYLLTPQGAR